MIVYHQVYFCEINLELHKRTLCVVAYTHFVKACRLFFKAS